MIIEQIKERLQKYPQLAHEELAGYLRILPLRESGFAVWVQEGKSFFTVGFGGWHEEFKNAEQALNCFAFGLSNACRLRVMRRGSVDYKWEAQQRVGDNWTSLGITGLLIFPYWRRAEERFLQNDVIDMKDEFEK